MSKKGYSPYFWFPLENFGGIPESRREIQVPHHRSKGKSYR